MNPDNRILRRTLAEDMSVDTSRPDPPGAPALDSKLAKLPVHLYTYVSSRPFMEGLLLVSLRTVGPTGLTVFELCGINVDWRVESIAS